MKPARIVVLVIAIAAGGMAALLAGRSDPPTVAPTPVAQLETVDVLIANTDIGLGHTVAAQRPALADLAGRRRRRELHPQERAAGRHQGTGRRD